MSHAWCRDIDRDEAVRAAEDGRTGPLPTLEEAIATITHKGDHMGTKSDEQAADYRRKASGLRTERVTLEFEIDRGVSPREWPWLYILSRSDAHKMRPSESVRVVEEFGTALPKVVEDMAAEITRLDSERDAAIRERDEAKQNHLRECAKCAALADKVISLRARVAELESAPAASGISSPQPISGDGKSAETGTQEPDAWGVRRKGGGVDAVIHRSQRRSAEHSAEQWGGTVVPLYAAPQPASGWLTEEEREMVQSWEQHYRQGSHYAQSPSHNLAFATEMGKRAKVFEGILARSSPPEVALPPAAKGETPLVRDLMWGQAIRAAGVTLKEVGK